MKLAGKRGKGRVYGLFVWAAAWLAALSVCISAAPWVQAEVSLPAVEITARAALLADFASGEILYERGIHEKAQPASLTKIMTALLALEWVESGRGSLDDMVTASDAALEDMPPDGSTQNIREGEIMSLHDLLYCTMISSANEACNVIAEHVAGSIPAFVGMMNEKAAALGCGNTQFTNTHGLPDEDHYTTAYDIYLITREALKYPDFMEICNWGNKNVEETNLSSARPLFTTNRLISTEAGNPYRYPPAKGIKTGHTNAAGYCLVSSAEKDGLCLLSIVMGAEEEEETGRILSFVETKGLFEWGFDNFTVKTLLDTKPVTQVKVAMGKDVDEVALVPARALEALVPKTLDPETDVERSVTLYEEGAVTAPVTRGQALGEIRLYVGSREFGVIPLVAADAVQRDEVVKFAEDVKGFFAQDWVKYTLGGLVALLIIYITFTAVYNARRKKARARGNYRGSRRRRRRR